MTPEEELLNEPEETPCTGLETALASEAVPAKDWLLPEEDEAWKDL